MIFKFCADSEIPHILTFMHFSREFHRFPSQYHIGTSLPSVCISHVLPSSQLSVGLGRYWHGHLLKGTGTGIKRLSIGTSKCSLQLSRETGLRSQDTKVPG